MDGFSQTNYKRTSLDLSLLLTVSVITALPVFLFGIPTGSDSPQHFQLALTVFDSIQNGNIFPGWAAMPNGGFGDVGIRFYPPLTYYVMSAFRCLSGNWYDASVLTFIFFFFVGGIGMYLWCREWFSENASLAAAIIYIFMPYHANQLYQDTLFAEFAGAAILPFCFLFVTRVCRAGKISDVTGLAVFYALLIITHLPLTVIGSISLLIYSLASFKRDQLFKALLNLSSAVFLGLSASSFYWLRMITELDFVKVTSPEFGSDLYDFRVNFLFSSLKVLLFGGFSRSSGNYDLMLLITLAVIVPSAAIFYRFSKSKSDRKLFNVAILLLFSIFIASPLSLGIWENFSPLQKVQFPWRWLAIVSLTSVVYVAAGFDILIDLFRTKRRPIALLVSGLIIAGIIFTFTRVINTSFQMPREDFTQQTKNLLNARSYDWAWTAWADKKAFANSEKVSADMRAAEIINWQRTEKEIILQSGESASARIAVFYYPHWKATVNGEFAELLPSEDGTIAINLPRETARVKIWFEEPFHIKCAYLTSLLIWLGFGLLGLYKISSARSRN